MQQYTDDVQMQAENGQVTLCYQSVKQWPTPIDEHLHDNYIFITKSSTIGRSPETNSYC